MLRYEYFCRYSTLFKVAKWVAMETMKFHITITHLFLRTIFVLHFSGPIEQNLHP